MPDYSLQNFESDTNFLYDYLRDLRDEETDCQLVIQHLQILFLEGEGYPEPEVERAVRQIIYSRWATERFSHILNHCCYIFINRWWLQPEFRFKKMTHELIKLFKDGVYSPASLSPAAQRLRVLVEQFIRSPYYETLQRYAQVAGDDQSSDGEPPAEFNNPYSGDRLGNLIYRYPTLYPFYIQDSTTNELGRKAVRKRQAYREQKFETELFTFASTLFAQTPSRSLQTAPRIINPTLLTEQQLRYAIQQFAGPVEQNSWTYRDVSKHFIKSARQASSFKAVKEQMRDYLTSAVSHPTYSKHLRDWLHEQLRDTLPQQDHQQPSVFMMWQTCSQLLELIVANPNPEQPHKHGMFISLHGNLGATVTIGLLLKIVLLCQWLGRNAKDTLESMKARVSRQFANLFRHYEHQAVHDAKWLIECLDNLMVAFTIHFGQQDYRKWASVL